MGFPDTQKVEEINTRAREMEAKRLELAEAEAKYVRAETPD
jgi:hypothetical protein